MASNEATYRYPLWLGKDNVIHCDLDKLEEHLIQLFNSKLSQKDVTDMAKTIQIYVTDQRSNGNPLQLASQKVPRLLTCVILNSFGSKDIQSLFCDRDEHGNTALNSLAESNTRDVLELLCNIVGMNERYLMFSNQNSAGLTALHSACIHGNTEALLVIKEHVTPEQWYELLQITDNDHRTPLRQAVLKSQKRIIKQILRSLNASQIYEQLSQNHNEDKPILHHIICEGYTKVTRLIQQSVETEDWYRLLQIVDSSGSTVLMLAVMQGNRDLVSLINGPLNDRQQYELLQITDHSNKTALHWASHRGSTAIITQLLECVSVDQRYQLLKSKTMFDTTPLHCAVHQCHPDAAKLLLDFFTTDQLRLILKERDTSGRTLLIWAVQEGDNKIVHVLLHAISAAKLQGRLLNMTDQAGQTILHWAVWNNDIELVKSIQESLGYEQRFFSLQQKDIFTEWTPLHWATWMGHSELVQLIHDLLPADFWYKLLQIGDIAGRTPLHFAAWQDHADIMWLICLFSSDDDQWFNLLSLRDDDEVTALNLARFCKHQQLETNIVSSLKRSLRNDHWLDKTVAPQNFQHQLIYTGYLFNASIQQEEPDGMRDTDNGATPKNSVSHASQNLSSSDKPVTKTVQVVQQGDEATDCLQTEVQPLGTKGFKLGPVPEPDETKAYEKLASRVLVHAERELSPVTSCQRALNKIHGDLHMMLAGETEEQSNQTVTCTLASYSHQSEHHHLLLIANGRVASIPQFLDSSDDHTLKVTTTHSRNPILLSLIDNDDGDHSFASHSAFSEPEVLLNKKSSLHALSCSVMSTCSTTGTDRVYEIEGIKLTIQNKVSPTLTIEISFDGQSQLSVNGSFCRMASIDDEFQSLSSLLSDLDEPDDVLDVTAVLMVVMQANHSPIALYMFLAGHLADTVDEKGERWMISTVRLRNDDLYEMIAEQCAETLSSFDQSAELEQTVDYWNKESLLFAITATLPEYNCDGLGNLHVLSADSMPCDGPTRRRYTFSHPDNVTALIRIFEPHSPGLSELVPADEDCKVSLSLQKSQVTGENATTMTNFAENPQNPVSGTHGRVLGASHHPLCNTKDPTGLQNFAVSSDLLPNDRHQRHRGAEGYQGYQNNQQQQQQQQQQRTQEYQFQSWERDQHKTTRHGYQHQQEQSGNRSAYGYVQPDQSKATSGSQRKKKGKPKMNDKTRRMLSCQQTDINHMLRAYHNKDGGKWNYTVTAVIVTLTDGDSRTLRTSVILFGGTLTSSKANSLIEGDGDVGIVVSLQWIFNESLRNMLENQWQQLFRGYRSNHAGDYSHAAIQDYTCLESGQISNLRLMFPNYNPTTGKISLLQTEITFEAKSPNESYKVSINMNNSRLSGIMNFRVQSSTHSVITFTKSISQREGELRELVYQALGRPQTADNVNHRITISFHHLTAHRQETPSEEKYVICAIGGMTDLTLPSQFLYHDPRHLWACVSWSENNSQIQSEVEKLWCDMPDDKQLAKHAVYYWVNDRDEPKQLLHIDASCPEVRYSRDMKDMFMDTWAHEHNPNSLADLIVQDEALWEELKSLTGGLLKECETRIQRKLRQHPQTRSTKIQILRLCCCKQNDDRIHGETVFNLGEKEEPHIIFTNPQKDNVRRLLGENSLPADLNRLLHEQSVKMSGLINDYIERHLNEVPTSFKHPTMQLQLKKLPYPNQMGQPTRDNIPQILYLQRSSKAHFVFTRPKQIRHTKVTPTEAVELVSKILQNRL